VRQDVIEPHDVSNVLHGSRFEQRRVGDGRDRHEPGQFARAELLAPSRALAGADPVHPTRQAW
jgi:hypothetical protein